MKRIRRQLWRWTFPATMHTLFALADANRWLTGNSNLVSEALFFSGYGRRWLRKRKKLNSLFYSNALRGWSVADLGDLICRELENEQTQPKAQCPTGQQPDSGGDRTPGRAAPESYSAHRFPGQGVAAKRNPKKVCCARAGSLAQ
jgi:hypothetical protein